MSASAKGRLIGVGTGPGDPELMTLKAVRALAVADVVAHFSKRGANGNARTIVGAHRRPDWIELPLVYPVTTEIDKDSDDYKAAITGFYEESATRVAEHLDQGRTVAILSEGDPLFYGSYMHLHVRLAHRYPTEVIPGVTAMSSRPYFPKVSLNRSSCPAGTTRMIRQPSRARTRAQRTAQGIPPTGIRVLLTGSGPMRVPLPPQTMMA